MPKRKRTEYVTLALTPEERAVLDEASDLDQRGHTVYARLAALEKARHDLDERDAKREEKQAA